MITFLEKWVLNNLRFILLSTSSVFVFVLFSKKASSWRGKKNRMAKIKPIGVR